METPVNSPNLHLFDLQTGIVNFNADITDHNTAILIGKTNSNNSNLLIECDFSGNIVNQFNVINKGTLVTGCKALNAGYLFFTSIYSSTNNYDFYVSLYSQNGTEKWNTSIGSTNLEQARCMKATNDGNIFIAGNKSINTTGARYIYSAKLDIDGNVIWTVEIPASISSYLPQDILITPQNELLIFVNNNAGSVIIHKISADGKNVNSFDIDISGSIMAATFLKDGNIMCCGNGTNSDVLLLKLTNKFEKTFMRNLGKSDHSEFATSIVSNQDGSVSIAGYVVGKNTKSYDALYIKTNENGDPLIYRGFGDQSTDQGLQILNHHGGDNLVLGLTFANSQGGGFLQQTFLTEIDNKGNFK